MILIVLVIIIVIVIVIIIVIVILVTIKIMIEKSKKVVMKRIEFSMPAAEKRALENYAQDQTKSIADIFRDAVKPITKPDNKNNRSA